MGARVYPDGIAWRRNSGPVIGIQPQANLIEGANILLAVTEDPSDGEVETTISTSGTVPGDYAGYFEQATQPTTVQIPNGTWGYWFDTDHVTMWLLRNKSNVLYGVQMTAM